jgi:hypothetical protein
VAIGTGCGMSPDTRKFSARGPEDSLHVGGAASRIKKGARGCWSIWGAYRTLEADRRYDDSTRTIITLLFIVDSARSTPA